MYLGQTENSIASIRNYSLSPSLESYLLAARRYHFPRKLCYRLQGLRETGFRIPILNHCPILQGESSGHFLSSSWAHWTLLSEWQVLQEFGIFIVAVAEGGMNLKV